MNTVSGSMAQQKSLYDILSQVYGKVNNVDCSRIDFTLLPD
jgi:hypothetical protein